MTTVTVNDTFDAPVERVWPLVSDFGGLVGIVPGVEECRVEGSGLGADRVIPTADGGSVVERLTWLDHDNHALSYSIVSGSPFPWQRYVATVKLTPAGDRTDIEWQGNFDPDEGVPEEKVAKIAGKLYAAMIGGYKSALAG
jgi:hypothetical protein